MSRPAVSVGIVTYNSAKEIANVLESMLTYTKEIELCVYVLDNGSTDDTVALVRRQFPAVTVLENEKNGGFGYGHNQVLPLLTSQYHAIVNPDIVLTEDALSALVAYMEQHPEVVMTTPAILNEDGTEQILPKRDPKFRYLLARRLPFRFLKKQEAFYTGRDETHTEPYDIAFCTGCFMLLRTELFKALHGFDERFFMYFEDADLTRRAREHGAVRFVPQVRVVHKWERAGARSGRFFLIQVKSMFLYFQKWRGHRA